jgi:putative endonuclease
MGIFFQKNKDNNLSTGAYGEKLAANYLQKNGYEIIETNFKNPYGRRLGEIDIIAKKENILIFVEVKTRRLEGGNSSLPEENITTSKIYKLNKAGQFYIKLNNLWDFPYRFDAISVWLDANNKTAKIKHIDNIFY